MLLLNRVNCIRFVPGMNNLRLLVGKILHTHTKKKKKKKGGNAYNKFFCFSELDKIFQLFHLYGFVARSFTKLFPKNHLIPSKSETVISLEMREGSKWNVTNVSV